MTFPYGKLESFCRSFCIQHSQTQRHEFLPKDLSTIWYLQAHNHQLSSMSRHSQVIEPAAYSGQSSGSLASDRIIFFSRILNFMIFSKFRFPAFFCIVGYQNKQRILHRLPLYLGRRYYLIQTFCAWVLNVEIPDLFCVRHGDFSNKRSHKRNTMGST